MREDMEGLDLLARMRVRETILMALITVTAVLANLPPQYIERLGINPGILLAVLGCAVILGLFFYLKFFLFLCVVLLVAGANLPAQIAQGLNISKAPILMALVVLVGVALINDLIRLLPTGLEPRPRARSPEGVRAMLYAIETNNPAYARRLLSMNFEPNMRHENGFTPLAFAAMKGNPRMVELFLGNGADAGMPTREGDTPVELALRFGHGELAETLRAARSAAMEAPARDADILITS
jgi:uncharacterized protein